MALTSRLTCACICACMYVTTVSAASIDKDTEPGTAVATTRMKMSNFFHPAMLLPQLIFWGFLPILLANLKMFVMNALMINNMALSSAIYMTLRNIVFGPRPGPMIKYANKGYKPHSHKGR